jgi:hypothetical protein
MAVNLTSFLVRLAQDDPHVVRVPKPARLDAAPPVETLAVMEARLARRLTRSLILHVDAHVIEACAGGLVLKRYVVGIGAGNGTFQLEGGGIYTIDGDYALVVDPELPVLCLRDGDLGELCAFTAPGAHLVRAP